MAKLTERQRKAMEKHRPHHTKQHIKVMMKELRNGKSFTKAHEIAMKKVGK
tara:strand:+ start:666 stop:818 length:153 start_codon:yes stop_codon:yes gene_type:complete